ncbi:BadF/BadG/BcrA/BcrD ATPase family protein [Streptosporangium subroseum]|uniref:BadF/BadG/BcrA/BcrD ATPase family protein n=1 Tax=Streptosporangium subroseum TaxID=106412 RepID=A0A239GCQ6_9ACTN|nr:BadF/BadG/BcrA/BcrD ATPase family protein [Streptosporangium subroseum]SNS66900.1 BadF/BadG/BcrA/BcrD ATPase family protein [Streptosporangium subroseum]
MFVLGLDVGGTSSRAVLLDASGRRVGYGRAAGGNPAAHGTEVAAANIGRALEPALRGIDPAQVAGAVIGMAGAGALERTVFDLMWASAGLRPAPRLTGDLGIAFAAGTAEPCGTVLIAGTGAIAARIEDGEPTVIADGLGWLLGDEGSGFWLGREAARVAARALSRGEADGCLVRLVAGALRDDESPPDAVHVTRGPRGPQGSGNGAQEAQGRSPGNGEVLRGGVPEIGAGAAGTLAGMRALAIKLVIGAQSRPPLELARLAPLVSQAAAEGDPAALEIVDTAARLLCRTVAEVRTAEESGPVVLSGSVLTSEGPVCSAVRERLGASTVLAGDGAGAAAWLAGREAFGWDPVTAARLHERIVSGG